MVLDLLLNKTNKEITQNYTRDYYQINFTTSLLQIGLLIRLNVKSIANYSATVNLTIAGFKNLLTINLSVINLCTVHLVNV